MLGALIFLIGSAIAAFGFFVMRNPMRLALLAPAGTEGYYQRMVLDPSQRNQLRIAGMVASFFGLFILTEALQGLLRFSILGTISEALLGLLWLSFIMAFVFGVVYAIAQLIRGRWKELFGGFRMWRQGIELGVIDVYPTITPRMCREAKAFTIVYCLLVVFTLAVAVVVRLPQIS